MRRSVACAIIGLFFTGWSGGMGRGGSLSGAQNMPPACQTGNIQLCQQQLMQQNQQQYGMMPQQMQMIQGGMGGGMMMQSNIVPQGMPGQNV